MTDSSSWVDQKVGKTIIIMTSNLGSRSLEAGNLGFYQPARKTRAS